MSSTSATFIYRGQLGIELSRIRFLLAATCAAFDKVDVVLLSPGAGSSRTEWEDFARTFPAVRSCAFVRAESSSVLRVRRRLAELIAPDADVIGVGFSVAAFLPMRKCLAWAVNGIPEERLLHGSNLRSRLAVRLAWMAAKRIDPALTVVVSDPMARLVNRRVGATTIVVPNAVDRGTFRTEHEPPRTFLTYQGGGSPWQGLDGLAAIWEALHRSDPSLRFRVITQDDRAKTLADRLPSEVVDIRSTGDANELASYLSEARLGFLVRAPGIVNEVSWPMKLGEYLSSGVPVAVTRCGWDAERLIERHSAGLVIEWGAPPAETAAQIVRYLNQIGSSSPPGVESAASTLDSGVWTRTLRDALARSSTPVSTIGDHDGR